jgi:hypothetical protein
MSRTTPRSQRLEVLGGCPIRNTCSGSMVTKLSLEVFKAVIPRLTNFHERHSPMAKELGEHHRKAAEHHEHAARHHKEAAKHHDAGAHEKAAHHAHIAHGHHLHAKHHADEAAKAHSLHHSTVAA